MVAASRPVIRAAMRSGRLTGRRMGTFYPFYPSVDLVVIGSAALGALVSAIGADKPASHLHMPATVSIQSASMASRTRRAPDESF